MLKVLPCRKTGVDGGYVVSVKYNAIIKIPSKGQAEGYMHVSCGGGGGGYTYECAKAGDFNVRKICRKPVLISIKFQAYYVKQSHRADADG